MLLNTLHVIACITSITLYYILFHDCTYLFRLFWLFLLSQLLSDTLHHIDHGTACFLFRASMLLCVQFDGTIGAGLTLKLLERRLNNNFESYKGEDSQIFRGQHSCMMSMSCFVRQTFAHIHKPKGRRKLCKCPNFCRGRKALASLQVILGQFLHEEARGWFPSRGPPAGTWWAFDHAGGEQSNYTDMPMVFTFNWHCNDHQVDALCSSIIGQYLLSRRKVWSGGG